jgi:hypothetical protein
MKLIFIAGSWGSGTTAVIGALDSLGVPTLGPHFQSKDQKTKNTFELVPFRKLVHRHVDEAALRHRDNYRESFVPALQELKTRLENNAFPNQPDPAKRLLALKMPLASLCLPEICSTFDTRLIVVHRPLDEIDASRLRRNWGPLYGASGAQHLYGHMFNDLVQHKLSFLGVSYGDFVNNTRQSLKKIIGYCDLEHLQKNLGKAEAFVRAP